MVRSGSRVPLALALGVALTGPVIAVVAVLVTATGTESDRTMRISSSSMEPTYPQGGHVTVRSVGTTPVRRGQVIAFSARDWGSDLVFRPLV
jgi:signal peptidase I